MTEEIINADGSRNWQANILLDNIKRLEQERNDLQDRLLTLADTYQETRNVCKRLKQENKELKKILQQTKQEVSKLSDKVPQMIMRNKELEKENEELKKTMHQPDFLLALADVSNGERNRRINLLSRYEQALRRICNKTRLMLSVHSKRIATNGELFSVITEANALSNEVLKWQKY